MGKHSLFQDKSKLLSQVRAQESVIQGLRMERKLWGEELAQQGISTFHSNFSFRQISTFFLVQAILGVWGLLYRSLAFCRFLPCAGPWKTGIQSRESHRRDKTTSETTRGTVWIINGSLHAE